MLNWIAENVGLILVVVLMVAAVVMIARKLIRDKKKGKTACGCGCAHCAMAGMCHKQKQSDS